MNFYQRANLSMGLAVFLGFELALSSVLNGNAAILEGDQLDRVNAMLWIAFQFLFRIKVTIDDHNVFSHPSPKHDTVRLLDFILFCTAAFLFVVAAIYAFEFAISGLFFLLGLLVATLWLWLHGEDWKIWTVINAIYATLVVLLIHLWVVSPWIKTLLLLLLLGFLALDFKLSKTANRMPSI
ncbi:hypothetical protein [Ferrimonas balearica]|uniref:hypothetical protein n=1 Tax=Ferrimonas balearica TaxID=44012 RepID=UPI001C9973D1|nr:hypothetical protein [Ferrimonas balearica]MBY5991777.1 hypothetical protein [Ferrimonas balearica]